MTLTKLIQLAVKDANARGKGGEQVNITVARNLIHCFMARCQREGWQLWKFGCRIKKRRGKK